MPAPMNFIVPQAPGVLTEFAKNFIQGKMARAETEQRRAAFAEEQRQALTREALMRSSQALQEREQGFREDVENRPGISVSPYSNSKLGVGVVVTATDKKTGSVLRQEFKPFIKPEEMGLDEKLSPEELAELKSLWSQRSKMMAEGIDAAQKYADILKPYRGTVLPPPTLSKDIAMEDGVALESGEWNEWLKRYNNDKEALQVAVDRSRAIYTQREGHMKAIKKVKDNIAAIDKRIAELRGRSKKTSSGLDELFGGEGEGESFDPFKGL